MRRNSYVLRGLVWGGVMGCENEGGFKVEGRVWGGGEKMVYLEERRVEGMVEVDCVKLDEEGSLGFWGRGGDCGDLYGVGVDNEVINLCVDCSERVRIKGDNWGFGSSYEVEG